MCVSICTEQIENIFGQMCLHVDHVFATYGPGQVITKFKSLMDKCLGVKIKANGMS